MISLDEAIKASGGLSAVARKLGISPQTVFNWVDRGAVPIRYGAPLEDALDGRLRRWDLFPSDWFRTWPELIDAPGAPPVPAQEAA